MILILIIKIQGIGDGNHSCDILDFEACLCLVTRYTPSARGFCFESRKRPVRRQDIDQDLIIPRIMGNAVLLIRPGAVFRLVPQRDGVVFRLLVQRFRESGGVAKLTHYLQDHPSHNIGGVRVVIRLLIRQVTFQLQLAFQRRDFNSDFAVLVVAHAVCNGVVRAAVRAEQLAGIRRHMDRVGAGVPGLGNAFGEGECQGVIVRRKLRNASIAVCGLQEGFPARQHKLIRIISRAFVGIPLVRGHDPGHGRGLDEAVQWDRVGNNVVVRDLDILVEILILLDHYHGLVGQISLADRLSVVRVRVQGIAVNQRVRAFHRHEIDGSARVNVDRFVCVRVLGILGIRQVNRGRSKEIACRVAAGLVDHTGGRIDLDGHSAGPDREVELNLVQIRFAPQAHAGIDAAAVLHAQHNRIRVGRGVAEFISVARQYDIKVIRVFLAQRHDGRRIGGRGDGNTAKQHGLDSIRGIAVLAVGHHKVRDGIDFALQRGDFEG